MPTSPPRSRSEPEAAGLAIIAAVARNRVIGRGNALPWHLPADLRHFRRLTLGAAVIMGRRTFESIGRALPERLNIVLTREPGRPAPGCRTAGTLDEALAIAAGSPRVFVIGGSALYAAALPRAGRLHLTEIDADFEGDTRFPEFDHAEWVEIERETGQSESDPGLRFAFVTYVRRARPV